MITLNSYLDKLWHQKLKRPYKLVSSIDKGTGDLVVLLHGIGVSGSVWKHVADNLSPISFRVIALDLLGFGKSPKPDWMDYNVDDHARAVIRTVDSLRLRKQQVILVGHSMGSLVAVRVAILRPDIVKHLILYEMPLYIGLPDGRRYSKRRDYYFKLYNFIISQPTTITKKRMHSIVMKMSGLKVTNETWEPFIKSLKHTIMEQDTLKEIQELDTNIDVIYGALDLAVIKGNPRQVFAGVRATLKTHTITQPHSISQKSGKFIANRIEIASH
jgi:pimeloyl-ACP methyl ester carboxylesterase